MIHNEADHSFVSSRSRPLCSSALVLLNPFRHNPVRQAAAPGVAYQQLNSDLSKFKRVWIKSETTLPQTGNRRNISVANQLDRAYSHDLGSFANDCNQPSPRPSPLYGLTSGPVRSGVT